ncbi:hypothetical protein HZ326_13943 [Fusarium oxysporum f. sp. albedinis]|nr:hypothetical protein HZ326_13943 [Fusarium oxysporum f. sp. albedinis]
MDSLWRMKNIAILLRAFPKVFPLATAQLRPNFEPGGKSETAFRDYTLKALDTDYSTFLKGNDAHNLSTKVGHLAGVSSDSSSEISTNIKSSVVRTKSLMQHYKVFEQLISSEAKSDIITLMERNDRKAFLVVCLKSVLDASHVQKFNTEESLNVNIKVPVGKGAEVASHGTVHLGDTVDPEINYTNSSGQKVEIESTMTGERIFAVRYRLTTLSRNKPNYGDVVRVKFVQACLATRRRRRLFLTRVVRKRHKVGILL